MKTATRRTFQPPFTAYMPIGILLYTETSVRLFLIDDLTVRQRTMQTTTTTQLGSPYSPMFATPINEFHEQSDRIEDWKPIETALMAMDPATTGRPPCRPLTLFKMRLLQSCYCLSDPQAGDQVSGRLS